MKQGVWQTILSFLLVVTNAAASPRGNVSGNIDRCCVVIASLVPVTQSNQLPLLGHTLTYTTGGTSDLIWRSAKVDSPVFLQIWISLRQNLIWVIGLGGEAIAKNLLLRFISLSWKYYLWPDLLILQMHPPGKHLHPTLRTILRMNGLTPSIVITLNGLFCGEMKITFRLFLHMPLSGSQTIYLSQTVSKKTNDM